MLRSYLTGYSAEVREAALVTYYKQGDSYLQRFLQKPASNVTDSVKYIRPGEGCRVLVQRERFRVALGINK